MPLSNALGIYGSGARAPPAPAPDAYSVAAAIAPPATELYRWSAADRTARNQYGQTVEWQDGPVRRWLETRSAGAPADWTLATTTGGADARFVVAADGCPGVVVPQAVGLVGPPGRAPPTDRTVLVVCTIPDGAQTWPDWPPGGGGPRSALDGAALLGVWSPSAAAASPTADPGDGDWEWSVRAHAPRPYDGPANAAAGGVRRLWVRRVFRDRDGVRHIQTGDAPVAGHTATLLYRDGVRCIHAHRIRATTSEFHRITSLNAVGLVVPMVREDPADPAVLDATTTDVPADGRWCLGTPWLARRDGDAPDPWLVPLTCVFHEVGVHAGALTDAQLAAECARLAAKWRVNPDTLPTNRALGSYDASAWSTLRQPNGTAASGAPGEGLARWTPALGSPGDLQTMWNGTTLPSLQASAASARLGVRVARGYFWEGPTTLPLWNVTVALAFTIPGLVGGGGAAQLVGRRESTLLAGMGGLRREGDTLAWYIQTDAWRLLARSAAGSVVPHALYVAVWTLRNPGGGAPLAFEAYGAGGAADPPPLLTATVPATGYRALPTMAAPSSLGGYGGGGFLDNDDPGCVIYELTVFTEALSTADMLGVWRVLRRKWEV